MDLLEKERIVRVNIINIFKEYFTTPYTEEEILNICPEKNFGDNLVAYYEAILDIFLIDSKYLINITGDVKHTIGQVAKLWQMTPHSAMPW